MNKFMREAIKEAIRGFTLGHGGPFGSVVVRQNASGEKEIIARGHNMVIADKNPLRHGEMVAMENATKALKTFDLSGCDLYTTGEPCPMCLAAMMWANINNIFYGCTIEDNEKIGFRDQKFDKALKIDRNKIPNLYQIDRDMCLILFDEYNKSSIKKLY